MANASRNSAFSAADGARVGRRSLFAPTGGGVPDGAGGPQTRRQGGRAVRSGQGEHFLGKIADRRAQDDLRGGEDLLGQPRTAGVQVRPAAQQADHDAERLPAPAVMRAGTGRTGRRDARSGRARRVESVHGSFHGCESLLPGRSVPLSGGRDGSGACAVRQPDPAETQDRVRRHRARLSVLIDTPQKASSSANRRFVATRNPRAVRRQRHGRAMHGNRRRQRGVRVAVVAQAQFAGTAAARGGIPARAGSGRRPARRPTGCAGSSSGGRRERAAGTRSPLATRRGGGPASRGSGRPARRGRRRACGPCRRAGAGRLPARLLPRRRRAGGPGVEHQPVAVGRQGRAEGHAQPGGAVHGGPGAGRVAERRGRAAVGAGFIQPVELEDVAAGRSRQRREVGERSQAGRAVKRKVWSGNACRARAARTQSPAGGRWDSRNPPGFPPGARRPRALARKARR